MHFWFRILFITFYLELSIKSQMRLKFLPTYDSGLLIKLHFITIKLIAIDGHHFYVKLVRIIPAVLSNAHEINEHKGNRS